MEELIRNEVSILERRGNYGRAIPILEQDCARHPGDKHRKTRLAFFTSQAHRPLGDLDPKELPSVVEVVNAHFGRLVVEVLCYLDQGIAAGYAYRLGDSFLTPSLVAAAALVIAAGLAARTADHGARTT